MIRLPVALVGAGHRARSVYAPLITGTLADRFELVGVVSRREASARALGEAAGCPGAVELQLAWGARGLICSASAHENGRLAASLLPLGLPLLLETPLALDVDEARALVDAPVPIEVAEQNPRFPRSLLLRELVDRGLLGDVRAVASDACGYRYHATALGRALLGRRRGLWAVAARTVFGDDFGRGLGPESLLAGTVSVDGDRLFQLREGEALHLGGGPWPRSSWWLAGDRGGVVGDRVQLRGGGEAALVQETDGAGRLRAARVEGAIEFSIPLPTQAALTEDEHAVARCLLDWVERIEGRTAATGWSAHDGLADLLWVQALERSAALGGARITLRA